jgi:hypothetical protein
MLSDLWLHYEAVGRFDDCIRIMDVLAQRGDRTQNESIKMGLSAVPNSHNSPPKGFSAPRTRKGLRGIRPKAKCAVRSAVKFLETIHGIDCLFLGTVTVPPLTDAELLTLNQSWPSVVSSFKIAVRRQLIAAGMPEEMVIVTEVQPKRYSQTGRVYLHLHFVIVNRAYKGSRWALQRSDLNRIWLTALSNKLNRPIAAAAACQLDPCHKSATNEIGKYLSKGGSIIEDIKRDGKAEFLPKSWYSITKGLRSLVNATTEKHQNECVNLFVDNIELFNVNNLTDIKPIYRRIYDDSRFGKFIVICVGYHGHIKDDFASKFRSLLGSKAEMLDFIGLLSLETPTITLKTA